MMKLDDVKKLHQKKYRGQFGFYLVEGEHLVLELVKAVNGHAHRSAGEMPTAESITLYVTDEYEQKARALDSRFTLVNVTQKQMSQMSDTKTPQGIIACVPLPSAKARSTEGAANATEQMSNKASNKELGQVGKQRYVYLHEVQDPGNLGTILRTLAWFDNFTLLLSPNSVDPFNSKVVRSSMGAIFHVPIELEVSLDGLQTRFSRFAYLDMAGEAVTASSFSDFDCYLFGNEARGVPKAALSQFNAEAYTIAGSGKIDSLNLASAVNMCVYELSR